MTTFTETQLAALEAPGTSFWRGPAGTGKSFALQQRLLRLLRAGEPAYTMMVLAAEPEQGQQFESAVQSSGLGPYADLTITTYTKLALDLTTLFWPLVAGPAGFSRPYRPPVLLTYDMAQLLMWRLIKDDLDAGAYTGLRLRPQQIISQLLDTLNRAALNRLALEPAVERQLLAWTGEKERLQHIRLAGRMAQTFRAYCLEHSLLDLSLTVQVFDQQLVDNPEFHRYFSERYRHLLVDNIEEQTPAGQHFVSSLMDLTETTALVYDEGGGYKRFMGASPGLATRFQNRCKLVFHFERHFTAAPQMESLANLVGNRLQQTNLPSQGAQEAIAGVAEGRYRREMVQALIPRLQEALQNGVPAQEIAIVVPYLDGALRYMLAQALGEAGIPYRLLRRRSSPREEPRVRAWLTWLALAYPQWGIVPTTYDVAEALSLSIFGLDPARAQLAATALYDDSMRSLRPIEEIEKDRRVRIGTEYLELIEELRLWLIATEPEKPLDIFLHDLFAQLLAQERFQPEPDVAGAAVCDWLVRTATRLREVAPAMGIQDAADLGTTFIDGIYQGLVTANPPDLGEPPDPEGITISTIYGYLLAGSPVQLQVWLETAASGWWDIPRQPLSNAFVLAPDRGFEEPWTMADDIAVRNELLSRIIRGLANRTKSGVIVANSDLDRRGARQEGPLWRALLPILPGAGAPASYA